MAQLSNIDVSAAAVEFESPYRTPPRPKYNGDIGLSTAAATAVTRARNSLRNNPPGSRAPVVAEGVGPAPGWDWSARRFLRRGGASYAAAHRLWLRVYTFECDFLFCGSGIAMDNDGLGQLLLGLGLGTL